jgi:hypothetical protein
MKYLTVDVELALYSQEAEDELVLKNTSAHQGPDSRTCDLYDLLPATPYFVQVNFYRCLAT